MSTALADTATPLLPHPYPEHPPTMAFVDANYLQRAVCSALATTPHKERLDVSAVRDWLLAGWADVLAPRACRRVYWYDGAYDVGHTSAVPQQHFLQMIGRLDLIHPRLGHLANITPRWQGEVRATLVAMGVDLAEFEERCPLVPARRQKGVDITLALDLVRLAERGMLSHALLLAGDSDFVPAIELARDAGVLITVITPERSKPPARLTRVADQTIEIPAVAARRMLLTRDRASDPQPRSEAATEEAPAHPSPPPRATRRGTRAGSPERPVLRGITGTGNCARRPAPAHPARTTQLAPAPSAPGEDRLAPASFKPFCEEDRAGLAIASPEGSARLFLAPSVDGRHVAVCLEHDGGEVTLATHDLLSLVAPPVA